MQRIAPISRCLPSVVLCLAMSACQGTPPKLDAGSHPDGDDLMHPLRFHEHAFEPHCYNTLRCKVVYNHFDFDPGHYADEPQPAPPPGDYHQHWGHASYAGVQNFPPPARVEWTSLDGVAHVADVDLGAIFKDQRVLYRVPDEEIPERSWNGLPGIHLEVNDRTISVYMQASIATKTEQIPGNRYSYFRDDVILAWTHTY